MDNPHYVKNDSVFASKISEIQQSLEIFEMALRAKLDDESLGASEYLHAEDK